MKIHTPIKPIQEVLDYIKENYIIKDAQPVRNDGYIGSIGSKKYRQFQVPYYAGKWKRRYLTVSAHHISWFLNKRHWPEEELDHKDDNRLNNDINNLNYLNRIKQMTKNYKMKESKLPIGVKFKGTRYEVYIRINGKKKYIGSAKNAEDAGNMYRIVYLEVYGEELNQ